MGAEAKFNANFESKKKPVQQVVGKWRKKLQGGQPGFRWNDSNQQKGRDKPASVDVRPDWPVKAQITYQELTKLSVDVPVGEEVLACGTLQYYDKSFDRLSTKAEKKLDAAAGERTVHRATTSDDPHIAALHDAKEHADVRVYGTDAILAVIMAAPRSSHSWDIVVNRVGNKLFFDKRLHTPIDTTSCNETRPDAPGAQHDDDDEESLNFHERLTMEASHVNACFVPQVPTAAAPAPRPLPSPPPPPRPLPPPPPHRPLLPPPAGIRPLTAAKYAFKDAAQPFTADEGAPPPLEKAYRYTKFTLGKKPKGDEVDNRVSLMVRAELDCMIKGKQEEDLTARVYALNEVDPKLTGGIDWRQKLDSMRGAVLATELKNNSNKLAKWTLQAILANADVIKLGYVSRAHVKKADSHVILGTDVKKPREFATQVNLQMPNAWGILRHIIDLCLAFDEGKYLLLKDPNKPVVRLYSIPLDAFDDEYRDAAPLEDGADGDEEY